MGIEKSELKQALLTNLGREAVERRDALQAEVYRSEGGITALTNLTTAIERDVFARLKRDIDEGRLDPEKEAKQVDRYIRTCLNLAKHLGRQLSERLPLQKGQVLESTTIIKMLASSAAEEGKKIAALRAAQEAQETEDGVEEVPHDGEGPGRRPAGMRPAPPLKARRTAQEGPGDELDLRGPAGFTKPVEAPPEPGTGQPPKKRPVRKRRGKDS